MLELKLRSDLSHALAELSNWEKIRQNLVENNLKLKNQLEKSTFQPNFVFFCSPELESTTASTAPNALEITQSTSHAAPGAKSGHPSTFSFATQTFTKF